MRFAVGSLLLMTLALSACSPSGRGPNAEEGSETAQESYPMAIAPDIQQRLARFSPTEISADLSALSEEDRKVLDLVDKAARSIDEIFLRQVWTGNPELQKEIQGWQGEKAEAARAYYKIMYGPWDRLESFEPFIGDTPHPPGAGYYPTDMKKDELEGWLAQHPDDRQAFESTVTVIRRRDGGLVAVPYSEEYKTWLEPAADLLRQAAAATSNASLASFLKLRADAFLSDDYYQSDLAWMDLDAPVEVTIGPYETYEDDLFGYKAAFEAFITVALPEESKALARYKSELPWLERNLPIPDRFKNFDRGTASPIRVVDEVLTAGDARAGVQTLAYNLPNDERVREAKGSKKVLLRNVMRAKYDKILTPIAERVLAQDQLANVDFDAYFNEVLHHELSHGLGPGTITVDGKKTEVRLQLKELYSTIEEAKADVMGVYNILALIKKGEMPKELERTLQPTYLAGLFRAARFGVSEAHGQGVVAQFNYLQEKGALQVDADGRFRTVPDKFPGAIRDLLHDLLVLQAEGDYTGTAAFLERYGKPQQSLLDAIGRLEDVPVDIRPIYVSAGES